MPRAKVGDQSTQCCQISVGKPVGVPGRPVRENTIHLPDYTILGEPMDETLCNRFRPRPLIPQWTRNPSGQMLRCFLLVVPAAVLRSRMSVGSARRRRRNSSRSVGQQVKKDSFLPIGSCFPFSSATIFHQGAFLGTIAAPRKSTTFVNRMQCIDDCGRRRQVQAGGPALVTEVAQEINLGRAFQSMPHQPRVDAIEIFGFHQSECTACSAALSPHFIEKLLWKTPVSGNLQFESKNRSFSPAGSLMVLP